MSSQCGPILDSLNEYVRQLEGIREAVFSTMVMVNEIPAPTFKELNRAKFLVDRFSELEMLNTSIDEKGNAIGILPGRTGDNDILVTAHLDSVFDNTIDHTVTLKPNVAIGPGIGDNSLGVAVLGTLPLILRRIGLELDSNLVLLGSTRSLGKGNLEGIRFVLNNYKRPLISALCLEGIKIGRLSFSSIGMLRGELTYKIPELYDWTKFNSVGAIVDMNDMINRILEIPLPRKPKSTIVLGQMEAGTSYNTLPTKARLRFEIRSESDEIVSSLASRINYLAEEMTSKTGALVKFNKIALRKSGGTEFSHPLNNIGRNILNQLGISPRITPSTSEVTALIDKGIPALTIGLTDGENGGDLEESVFIEPISKGLAQLAGLLRAIDEECSKEH
ncbi:Acetylornithine deacetylase [Olavius algarvensis spirochete endosymbiont]|uniref:M28 family peptidase n=1 Tax=Olavius algarvensis spirochete endosymbiont TaxID=260710 RepID=UPI00052C40DA|nr:M28 family peptidase [Olavius algarvensis spirochete endosymbiont]KGM43101.1 peptidase [Alkalispirochaeta odontotermitis]VDB00587.1 Acetylornithine deacetylase [Olavius algarvensis spirochete endosymbiont]